MFLYKTLNQYQSTVLVPKQFISELRRYGSLKTFSETSNADLVHDLDIKVTEPGGGSVRVIFGPKCNNTPNNKRIEPKCNNIPNHKRIEPKCNNIPNHKRTQPKCNNTPNNKRIELLVKDMWVFKLIYP